MAVSNCIDILRISIIFSGRCVIAMKKKTGIQNNQVYIYIYRKKRTKKTNKTSTAFIVAVSNRIVLVTIIRISFWFVTIFQILCIEDISHTAYDIVHSHIRTHTQPLKITTTLKHAWINIFKVNFSIYYVLIYNKSITFPRLMLRCLSWSGTCVVQGACHLFSTRSQRRSKRFGHKVLSISSVLLRIPHCLDSRHVQDPPNLWICTPGCCGSRKHILGRAELSGKNYGPARRMTLAKRLL